MLKHFTNKFLRGFIALMPILLSVYILVWLLSGAETMARFFLLSFLSDQIYIPGLGILAAILFIYGVGVLLERPAARRVMRWVEEPFQILPLVRSVYQAIKDFTGYLSPNKKRGTSRVVVVKVPGTEFEIVGLVTRESTQGLPSPLSDQEMIAVYFPMSYQFGGYTAFVPKTAVREFAMGTEQAMRSVLTAWVSGAGERRDTDS